MTLFTEDRQTVACVGVGLFVPLFRYWSCVNDYSKDGQTVACVGVGLFVLLFRY